MSNTCLTTDELSQRIKFDPRYIRNSLKDSVLLEGIHYIRPVGNLQIVDIIAIPQRFHRQVGETEHQHVPHHALGEIVIYTKDLPFLQHADTVLRWAPGGVGNPLPRLLHEQFRAPLAP